MTIVIAKASHEAAKYAVEHWHYSEKLPSGKLFIRGVWEDGKYIGCVIFSRGASQRIGLPYGLDQTQCVELTRVALTTHKAFVSQIVAAAIADLKRGNPGLRLIVSFADKAQGHHGGIYQAGNWVYTGLSAPSPEYIVNGVQMHARSVHAKGWRQRESWLRENIDPNAKHVTVEGKHKYVMPLDKPMRRQIAKLAVGYPRRTESETATGSV